MRVQALLLLTLVIRAAAQTSARLLVPNPSKRSNWVEVGAGTAAECNSYSASLEVGATGTQFRLLSGSARMMSRADLPAAAARRSNASAET
jgi:hypothetical protein